MDMPTLARHNWQQVPRICLLCLYKCLAEQESIEQELVLVRGEEKRLIGLLGEKGAGPQSITEGTLAAMLKLEDKTSPKQ